MKAGVPAAASYRENGPSNQSRRFGRAADRIGHREGLWTRSRVRDWLVIKRPEISSPEKQEALGKSENYNWLM